jgi:hypothetical protein
MPVLSRADTALLTVLLTQGALDDEALQLALERSETADENIRASIQAVSGLSDRALARAVEDAREIVLIPLEVIHLPAEALAALSSEQAQQWRAIPFARLGQTLRVALEVPLDGRIAIAIAEETGFVVEVYQALPAAIAKALAQHYPPVVLVTDSDTDTEASGSGFEASLDGAGFGASLGASLGADAGFGVGEQADLPEVVRQAKRQEAAALAAAASAAVAPAPKSVPVALTTSERQLVALLSENGFVSDQELQDALIKHAEVGGRFLDVCLDHRIISEWRVLHAIELIQGIQTIDLTRAVIQPEALRLLSGEQAQVFGAIPIRWDGETVRVVVSDPFNKNLASFLESELRAPVRTMQAPRDHFAWALAKSYPELGLRPVPPTTNFDPSIERLCRQLLERRLAQLGPLETVLDLYTASQASEFPESFETLLLRSKAVSEEQLYQMLSDEAEMEFVPRLDHLVIADEVASFMLRSDAQHLRAVPVREDGEVLVVAGVIPEHRDEIVALLERPIWMVMTVPSQLTKVMERIYAGRSQLGERLVREGVSRKRLVEASRIRSGGRLKTIIDVLLALGYITPQDLEPYQGATSSDKIELSLVRDRKLDEEQLAKALALFMGYEFIHPKETPPDAATRQYLPEHLARKFTMAPFRMQEGALIVLMKDPRNILALEDLRLMTNRRINAAVAPAREIEALIERLYTR